MTEDPVMLVRRWCRGSDEDAFSAFYRSQSERLWRFLVARGVDREAAYDVLADTFERWMKTLCRDPRAPVALLYRIALNRSIDLHRRSQVREPVDRATLDAPADNVGLALDTGALLAGLSADEQNRLLLRYWVGPTHREVAAVLERQEGTIRRETARILHRLRERLDDD